RPDPPLFPYTTLFRSGCSVSGNHQLAVDNEEAVMKKIAVVMVVAFVTVMILAPAAMAQDNAAASSGGKALGALAVAIGMGAAALDRKSTRLNSSHVSI